MYSIHTSDRRFKENYARSGTGFNYFVKHRSFSTTELIVSMIIFLFISTLITLVVARALSASSAIKATKELESVLKSSLDQVSTQPYTDVLTGDFTVPNSCVDNPDFKVESSPTGVGARSCVDVNGRKVVIKYQYMAYTLDPNTKQIVYTDSESGASLPCTDATEGTDLSSRAGLVGLCATIESVNNKPPDNLPVTSIRKQVNAPTAYYSPGNAVIRVNLSGEDALIASRSLFLLQQGAPSSSTAYVPISSAVADSSGVAYFPVKPNIQCTKAQPCILGLSPSQSSPGVSGDIGIYGDAARPDAGLVVSPSSVLNTTATISRMPTLQVVFRGKNVGLAAAPQRENSVCVWGSFRDSVGKVDFPICNNESRSLHSSETYVTAVNNQLVKFPLPYDTNIRLSTDPLSGGCRVSGSIPDSSYNATYPYCTSWAWGLATFTTPTGTSQPGGTASVNLDPGFGQIVRADWVSDQKALTVPATGWFGLGSEFFDNPRRVPNCVASGTCSPVETALEKEKCDLENCLSSQNQLPYLVSPPGGYIIYSGAAAVSFKLLAYDPDTVGVYIYWGSVLPAGGSTFKGAPLSVGQLLASAPAYSRASTSDITFNAPSTQNMEICISNVPLTAPQAESCNIAGTRKTQLTLTDKPPVGDVIATPSRVVVDQGKSFTVNTDVTNLAGDPMVAASVSISDLPPGVTPNADPLSTNANGRVTFNLNTAISATPVVNHTSKVTVNGKSATFKITIREIPASIALSLSPGSPPYSVAQGSKGTTTATAAVKGSSNSSVEGAVVTFEVIDSSGEQTAQVYPAIPTCETNSSGECSVPLNVDASTPPDTYRIRAKYTPPGGLPMESSYVDFSVVSIPASFRLSYGAVIPQGGSVTTFSPVVLDASGVSLPSGSSLDLSLPDSDGGRIVLSSSSAVVQSSGKIDIALRALGDAKPGDYKVAVSSPGFPTEKAFFKFKVSAVTTAVTAAPLTVSQGSKGDLILTTTNPSGVPTSGAKMSIESLVEGVTVTSTVLSGSNGKAKAEVFVANLVPAGTYASAFRVIVEGIPYTFSLDVSPTPALLYTDTSLEQGASTPVPFVVYDRAGGVMPGYSVSVSLPGFTVSPASAVTSVAGLVSFNVQDDAIHAPGNYSGTATVNGIPIPVTLKLIPAVGSIDFTSPSDVLLPGRENIWTITVKDKLGAFIPSTVVNVDSKGIFDYSDVEVLEGAPNGTSGNSFLTSQDAGTVRIRVTPVSETLTGLYPVAVSSGSYSTSKRFNSLPIGSVVDYLYDPNHLYPFDDATSTPGVVDVKNPSFDASFSNTPNNNITKQLTGSGFGSLAYNMGYVLPTPPNVNSTISTPVSVIPSSGSFTFNVWVLPTSVVYPRHIFNFSNYNDTPGIQIGEGGATYGTTGLVPVRLRDTDGEETFNNLSPYDNSVVPAQGATIDSMVSSDNYTMLSVVYDSVNQRVKLYVNGQLADNELLSYVKKDGAAITATTTPPSGETLGSLQPTSTGVIGNTRGWRTDSLLDDFSIYNKELSPSEILAMNAARSPIAKAVQALDGLKGFVRFDTNTPLNYTSEPLDITVLPGTSTSSPSVNKGSGFSASSGASGVATLSGAATDVGKSTQWTMGFVMKPTASIQDQVYGILGSDVLNTATNSPVSIMLVDTAGQASLRISYGDGTGRYTIDTTPGSVAYNQWQLVTVVRDGKNFRIHVNNTSASLSLPSHIPNSPAATSTTHVGHAAGVNLFSGFLDEVFFADTPISVADYNDIYTGMQDG